jgi:hypothetical protein
MIITRTAHFYRVRPEQGEPRSLEGDIFHNTVADEWCWMPDEDCPGLNIHQLVTIVAFIVRLNNGERP